MAVYVALLEMAKEKAEDVGEVLLEPWEEIFVAEVALSGKLKDEVLLGSQAVGA